MFVHLDMLEPTFHLVETKGKGKIFNGQNGSIRWIGRNLFVQQDLVFQDIELIRIEINGKGVVRSRLFVEIFKLFFYLFFNKKINKIVRVNINLRNLNNLLFSGNQTGVHYVSHLPSTRCVYANKGIIKVILHRVLIRSLRNTVSDVFFKKK